MFLCLVHTKLSKTLLRFFHVAKVITYFTHVKF